MPVTTTISEASLQMKPLRYRGWLISTKVVDGQLWLRWQHPRESFPRYSYPVTERGLADTIRFARFLIDLAIRLENEELHQSAPKAG
ncbi:MAG TPA: hypothetical protein V6C91_08605 [Coleofasciculaceae cyanobacterium]